MYSDIALIIQAYWDWSWDELVAYDLPATFQYVLDQTGQKLHYVGHSLVNLHISSTLFCSKIHIFSPKNIIY